MARPLMATWEYPPLIEGGLGRHAGKLAERLAAQGHPVTVVTRAPAGAHGAIEQRGGVRVRRVAQPDYPRNDFEAFFAWVGRMNDALAAAAPAGALDAVHSHDWLVAEAGERLARERGVPWVVTVHATEHGRHQGWVQRFPQARIHAAERGMLERADRVIVCSRFMRAHIRGVFGVPAERISVIPNGVDPADLHPAEDLRALRARFAEPGEKLILLAGRLMYEKGFHLVLEVLPRLRRRIGPVRFVVAGAGMAERDLEAQAEALGLAGAGCFLGWTDGARLASLYRIADVCVVASLYEPFGLVALEAMAAGCPCVVSDAGGLREIVPAGAVAGVRFKAGSTRSLAHALERVLTDEALCERIVAGAAARVRSRYDWDDVARRTAALYAPLRLRA